MPALRVKVYPSGLSDSSPVLSGILESKWNTLHFLLTGKEKLSSLQLYSLNSEGKKPKRKKVKKNGALTASFISVFWKYENHPISKRMR